MRILIVANSSSGLYNFREMLIKDIKSKGHTIAAILPQSDEEIQVNAEKNLKKIGCKIYHVKMERRSINPFKDLRLMMSYQSYLRKWMPNLVITYTIKPNVYMGGLCALYNIPYAANITGLGTAFQNEGVLKKVISILYKIALRKAKVVFFENQENLRIMLKNALVQKEKVCLLNGAGVDTQKFSYIEYPEKESKINFLFIGRVMKEKGIEELFGAMQKLIAEGENCNLSIVGPFEEDYSDVIQSYEKEGWLQYYGVQKDVRPYIAESHCFVLPSWHEGMANTNLESASSGRPVITSNIHGCLEAVQDGITGFLCEKGDVESLYQSMKKFLQLPYTEKRCMGLAGRRHVEENFEKEKVVQKTIKRLF